jgi:hypothetical protein
VSNSSVGEGDADKRVPSPVAGAGTPSLCMPVVSAGTSHTLVVFDDSVCISGAACR